jgi:hypothetical protein
MQWIQYTGHWGEIGELDFTTGPHGPAIQDSWTEDLTDGDNPASHDWVFVDQSSPCIPLGLGSWDCPFISFAFGVSAVPNGGTVWIAQGNYSAAGTYSKRMILRSAKGGVVLQ